jgi:hypothetical protein
LRSACFCGREKRPDRVALSYRGDIVAISRIVLRIDKLKDVARVNRESETLLRSRTVLIALNRAFEHVTHPKLLGDRLGVDVLAWCLGGSLRKLPAPDLGRGDSTSNPASHHSNNGFADSQSKRE